MTPHCLSDCTCKQPRFHLSLSLSNFFIMGCKQTKTKISPLTQTSHEEALNGKTSCPRELFYAKSLPTPRLSGEEILKQLRDEGLVPTRHGSGGVAFSVPSAEKDEVPRGKPPRRLERIPVKGLYTPEERQMMADITRFDRLVEQVQRKALDRDIKRHAVLKEKERRQRLKKMLAEQKLMDREERLRRLEEERAAKKRGKTAIK